jgi:hypothetical protein
VIKIVVARLAVVAETTIAGQIVEIAKGILS